MEIVDLAHCLEKLGHPTRLEIFRLLVRAGPGGLPVGAIQQHLDIPPSTLSHHIANLVSAGLVGQRREGRVLRCTADYGRMDSVVSTLTAECCAGVSAGQPELEET